MSNVFDVLKERGFIQQTSHEDELRELLGKERITFYIGFDPTADSLHIGHYVPLVAMAHMQRAGHRPIALIGGGTAMIGDPSGRSDMRQMLTLEQIENNANRFKDQIGNLIDFSDGRAIMVNNADWLLNLNYVDFLRDIGVHFTVNRMLAAECFKSRMEKGLTFIEFNYMLMQSYDFLVLNREYGAVLQMGGDDQWANILAGADLIRRKEQRAAYAMTCSLLTTSEGVKMGKTQRGALWLDPKKTSPYEFYQYWRNVDDADVENCMRLLTFLPMEQIKAMCAHKDHRMNDAKRTLAYELARQVHGADEADKAQQAAESLFGGDKDADTIPATRITQEQYEANSRLIDLMALCGLAASKGEARRLVRQGGVYVDGEKAADEEAVILAERVRVGILIRKGKKTFHRIELI
ncbi:MAG: tyrosine--tRNA ligase [Bacillota bacterium]